MEIRISCKNAAKRRKSIQTISYQYDEPPKTVRDLLTETVKINVAEYEKRQESAEVLRILSVIYSERKPNLEHAVRTAWECFEDGIVVIFADGTQLAELEEPLALQEGSEVTFVRMTMLTGRMW